MLIRYFSDLHLEFVKLKNLHIILDKIKNISGEDICILAGDIGYPRQPIYDEFMIYISKTFKKTFIIAGNHEYYKKKKSISDTNTFLENYFTKFDNISFLNNTYEIYNDYCFIGSVLWSKVDNPKYEINDTSVIYNMSVSFYNELHIECVEFLKKTIPFTTNNIVITHHMPSYYLIDDKYKTPSMEPYNQWFASNMDEFIGDNQENIKCWIYGHTHTPSSINMNGVQFLCNPIGYPGENMHINFDISYNLS